VALVAHSICATHKKKNAPPIALFPLVSVPTKSVESCLNVKNTHKCYAMQIIGEMYIKCGLVLLKIDELQLSKLVLVVASQKTLVSAL
jgi:hypothetical protein